jgi:hypothetical protein
VRAVTQRINHSAITVHPVSVKKSNKKNKNEKKKERMVALRQRTPDHFRSGWSHDTDTS